jgi:hypothetical protein
MVFLASADILNDVITQMKTTQIDVESFIKGNIGYGSFGYPGACRLIPAGKRASVVNVIGEFAKSYTRSDAFLKWYEELRDQEKPKPQEEMKPMAEQRREQIEQLKKSLAEQEQAYKVATGDMKEVHRQVIEGTKQALQLLEKSDPAQDAMVDQYADQANATAKQEYEQKLVEWQKEFPERNPRPLIKMRLQEFLEATTGIDYAAKLVKKDKVMVFENPEYEQKDGRWKTGYRAGKEATEAARAFARAWLKELEK